MGLTKQERVASIIIEEVSHALEFGKYSHMHGGQFVTKYAELSDKYLEYILGELPLDPYSLCNGCEKEVTTLRSGLLCIPKNCLRKERRELLEKRD